MSNSSEAWLEQQEVEDRKEAEEMSYLFSCLAGLKSYLSEPLYQQVEKELGFGPK
jgi:hypothetical protein